MAVTGVVASTYQFMRDETGSLRIGFGSRPATPPSDIDAGVVFFDVDDSAWYYWDGSAWQTV